jgi:bifunctional non-homologous end joining protein LigD
MFDQLEPLPRTWDTVAVVTYDPMLPSPARRIPTGDQWAHEPKPDTMRCGVVVVNGKVRVRSRRLRDWTAAVPELSMLSALPSETVIDGELVTMVGDRPDFEVLRSTLNAPRAPRADGLLTYFAFDLLTVGGRNLQGQPWTARREHLESFDLATLAGGGVSPAASSYDGQRTCRAALERGMEGVVCKRRNSRYVPGRRGASRCDRPAPLLATRLRTVQVVFAAVFCCSAG